MFAQERKLIPDGVVEDILSLNSLDLELYEHAEMLYAKQKQLFLSLNQPQLDLFKPSFWEKREAGADWHQVERESSTS
jgi:hypothetical protein